MSRIVRLTAGTEAELACRTADEALHAANAAYARAVLAGSGCIEADRTIGAARARMVVPRSVFLSPQGLGGPRRRTALAPGSGAAFSRSAPVEPVVSTGPARPGRRLSRGSAVAARRCAPSRAH